MIDDQTKTSSGSDDNMLKKIKDMKSEYVEVPKF